MSFCTRTLVFSSATSLGCNLFSLLYYQKKKNVGAWFFMTSDSCVGHSRTCFLTIVLPLSLKFWSFGKSYLPSDQIGVPINKK